MTENMSFDTIYNGFQKTIVSLINDLLIKEKSVILSILKNKLIKEEAKTVFLSFRDEKKLDWKDKWLINKERVKKKDENYFLEGDIFESYIPENKSDSEKTVIKNMIKDLKNLWKNFKDEDKEVVWNYIFSFVKICDVVDEMRGENN